MSTATSTRSPEKQKSAAGVSEPDLDEKIRAELSGLRSSLLSRLHASVEHALEDRDTFRAVVAKLSEAAEARAEDASSVARSLALEAAARELQQARATVAR